MIERRYPIQTVLAERKMFAGGGAVLPQQMMPPQQSGGILASSGPLLDAVAAGAINPDGDGGGSLSDVQGFRFGGSVITPQEIPVNLSAEDAEDADAARGAMVDFGPYEPEAANDGFIESIRNVLGTSGRSSGAGDGSVLNILRDSLRSEQLMNENDPGESSRSSIAGPNKLIGDGSVLNDIRNLEYVYKPRPTPSAKTSNIISGALGQGREVADRKFKGGPGSSFGNPIMNDLSLNSSANSVPGYFGQDDTDSGYSLTPKEAEVESGDSYNEEGYIGGTPLVAVPLVDEGSLNEEGYIGGTPLVSDADREEVPIENASNPNEPKKMVSRGALFQALNRKGADPDVEVAAVDDIISRAARKSGGDSSVDVKSLKSDIESLLPAVEGNDDVTEGLMLIRLAAAIGSGTSSSGWENISKGVEKALPAIIEYRAKKKSDKRGRQMAIAKMAIQQKLSLDAETRAEDRSIRKEGRAIQKDKLKTKRYMVIRPKTIAASQITEGAEGNITIPKLMTFTLDSYGLERVENLGISVTKVGEMTPKFDDVMNVPTQHDAKTLNRLYTLPKQTGYAPFELFGENYRYMFMTPTYAGLVELGAKAKNIIHPDEAQSLHRVYKKVSQSYGKMYDQLEELNQIAQTKELVGAGAIKGQFGTALSGLSDVRFLKGFGIEKFKDMLLDGQDLSRRDAFSVKGRLLLAKMAPIILGESGKTISDADRIRVARSLGFEVDARVNEDGTETFRGITGFDTRILSNPNTIMAAINETATLVRDRYELIHMTYQQEMDKFDVNIPSLRKFAPIKRERSSTLRFDLRKKAKA